MEKQMTNTPSGVCEECGGDGTVDWHDIAGRVSTETCSTCNGTGKAVEAADAKVRRYRALACELHEHGPWCNAKGCIELVEASEYDAARAEIADLQAVHRKHHSIMKARAEQDAAELTTLRAKLAEAERDAGRWRFCVELCRFPQQIPYLTAWTLSGKTEYFRAETAADCVDAALQQGSTKGEA